MSPLLEIEVLHQRDVFGATEGGADRLFLTTLAGLSPDLREASAVLRETDLPVRVRLRLNDGRTTTGGEFTRLVGLAQEYVSLGAEGVVFGFLDSDTRIDVELCAALADALSGVPWTFSEALDECLEPQRAWAAVAELPGCDGVLAAGSPRGMAAGYEELLAEAQAEPRSAVLMLPGPGLLAEHVPWLRRAGVTQFHIGVQARPGGSTKAYVDAGHVRSWRLLLDD
ncbi:copper homeostasis protein CutC [Nocardioides alcanivorans]|uniref:copper homeostasis protein CutC n=1 Tax=Nocardioides alcanivorans TaxID=2897352 RepID=UPI001F3EC190|nr:copper homeostasis protein CutC [Nocardioides alcanivorans]